MRTEKNKCADSDSESSDRYLPRLPGHVRGKSVCAYTWVQLSRIAWQSIQREEERKDEVTNKRIKIG